MKSYITALLFALSADNIARADSFAPTDLTGDPGCIDLDEEPHVFDVNQACCHLYTEP